MVSPPIGGQGEQHQVPTENIQQKPASLPYVDKTLKIYVRNLAGDLWVDGLEWRVKADQYFYDFTVHFTDTICKSKGLDCSGLTEYKFLLELDLAHEPPSLSGQKDGQCAKDFQFLFRFF